MYGGERQGCHEQHGIEQVECDQQAAGDRHVFSGESCEDGARAYEGFEQQEDGGNYGEGQESGQFVSEADRFDEQPYTEQQGHARKCAMRVLYPGGESVGQREDFALAAGPVTAAAGAGSGGSDDGSLQYDNYVDG